MTHDIVPYMYRRRLWRHPPSELERHRMREVLVTLPRQRLPASEGMFIAGVTRGVATGAKLSRMISAESSKGLDGKRVVC